MKKVQKVYTKEFKEEAVELAKNSHKPAAQIARELGISDSALYKASEGERNGKVRLGQEKATYTYKMQAEHLFRLFAWYKALLLPVLTSQRKASIA